MSSTVLNWSNYFVLQSYIYIPKKREKGARKQNPRQGPCTKLVGRVPPTENSW